MTKQHTAADAPETPNGPATNAGSEDPQGQQEPQEPQEPQGHQDPQGEQDTFPRAYVEQLRSEAATHRVRAQRADELAAALWEARVAATGRLADPTDLSMPEDADPMDAEQVTASVDALLERKPHLASRVPRGDAGQGYQKTERPFSLLGALNQAAR